MTTQPHNNKRQLKGTVVSDAMDKTRVISVERFKKHPRYEKIYRRTKKFKAHDETNQYKKGDFVVIQETRPLSKDKRWEIVKKIGEAMTGQANESITEEIEVKENQSETNQAE